MAGVGYSDFRCFFPIRVEFDGLCRWVEWDKVALDVLFPIKVGFEDYAGGRSGIKWRWVFFPPSGTVK